MNTPPTRSMTVSSAQICRDQNWQPGDTLVDVEDPRNKIELSAIGHSEVLALQIEDAGGVLENPIETLWSLNCRNWKKV